MSTGTSSTADIAKKTLAYLDGLDARLADAEQRIAVQLSAFETRDAGMYDTYHQERERSPHTPE